jgi:hypothetical protein
MLDMHIRCTEKQNSVCPIKYGDAGRLSFALNTDLCLVFSSRSNQSVSLRPLFYFSKNSGKIVDVTFLLIYLFIHLLSMDLSLTDNFKLSLKTIHIPITKQQKI